MAQLRSWKKLRLVVLFSNDKKNWGRPADPEVVASSSETAISALVSYPTAQNIESTIGVGESTVLSEDALLGTMHNVHSESVVSHSQALPLQRDAHTDGATDLKAAPKLLKVAFPSINALATNKRKIFQWVRI